MKQRILLVYLLLLALVIACNEKKNYEPNTHLTPKQKDAMITTIVRHAAGAPPNSSGDINKFDAKYDSFYLAKASAIRLEQYYPKNDYSYFLISQPAPSLIEKRHATGGRFKLNDKGELTEYEEVFRTWKMVPDTLKRRSYFLFDKMVNGESLEPYYTRNSKGIEFIEFPDERVYYNKDLRSWRVIE